MVIDCRPLSLDVSRGGGDGEITIHRSDTRSQSLAKPVWLVMPSRSYNACRTPSPSMKRSLICTGSLRVVPTPGLSSMRTPIRLGPGAEKD